jgi:hypothetical protein
MSCFSAHIKCSACLILDVITLRIPYWVRVIKCDGMLCTSNVLCYKVNNYGSDQMDISVRLDDIVKLKDLVRN